MSLSNTPVVPNIEALQKRLRSLIVYHSRERGQIAEQLSQLLEENDRLKRRVRELEAAQPLASEAAAQPSPRLSSPSLPEASERALGLDFSLPKR